MGKTYRRDSDFRPKGRDNSHLNDITKLKKLRGKKEKRLIPSTTNDDELDGFSSSLPPGDGLA